MISTPPRMVIQQSMARFASFYHVSASTPLANHGDFFNTYRRLHQTTRPMSEITILQQLSAICIAEPTPTPGRVLPRTPATR